MGGAATYTRSMAWILAPVLRIPTLTVSAGRTSSASPPLIRCRCMSECTPASTSEFRMLSIRTFMRTGSERHAYGRLEEFTSVFSNRQSAARDVLCSAKNLQYTQAYMAIAQRAQALHETVPIGRRAADNLRYIRDT